MRVLPGSFLSDLHHDFDRIFDALARVSDGGWNFSERKGMSVDQLRVKPLLRHQSGRPVGGAPALAANTEYVNVIAHEISEIDRHRIGGKRGEANSPAAAHHSRSLVESVGRARALEHILHPLAAGNPLDGCNRLLPGHIDDFVCA